MPLMCGSRPASTKSRMGGNEDYTNRNLDKFTSQNDNVVQRNINSLRDGADLFQIALLSEGKSLPVLVQGRFLSKLSTSFDDVSFQKKRSFLQMLRLNSKKDAEKIFRLLPLSKEQVVEAVYDDLKVKLKICHIKKVKTSVMIRFQHLTTLEERSFEKKKVPCKNLKNRGEDYSYDIDTPWSAIITRASQDYVTKRFDIPGTESISTCARCEISKGQVSSRACSICEGNGKLKECKQVVSKIHRICDDFYNGELYGLPNTFLASCEGYDVFEEAPVTGTIDPLSSETCLHLEVILASESIGSKHEKLCGKQTKILKQKHRLTVLEMHRVTYKREGKSRELFIVGSNRKVYDKENVKNLKQHFK